MARVQNHSHENLSPSSLKELTDKYEADYGFMAVNAVGRNAQAFLKIHDEQSVHECYEVFQELLRRGWDEVKSQQQYDELVKKHGVPKHFGEEPYNA